MVGGRVMATASVEAARPFNLAMPQLMGAVFIDAGQAATSWGSYRPQIGWAPACAGAARWGRSGGPGAPSRPGAGGCTPVSALRYEPARSHLLWALLAFGLTALLMLAAGVSLLATRAARCCC